MQDCCRCSEGACWSAAPVVVVQDCCRCSEGACCGCSVRPDIDISLSTSRMSWPPPWLAEQARMPNCCVRGVSTPSIIVSSFLFVNRHSWPCSLKRNSCVALLLKNKKCKDNRCSLCLLECDLCIQEKLAYKKTNSVTNTSPSSSDSSL